MEYKEIKKLLEKEWITPVEGSYIWAMFLGEKVEKLGARGDAAKHYQYIYSKLNELESNKNDDKLYIKVEALIALFNKRYNKGGKVFDYNVLDEKEMLMDTQNNKTILTDDYEKLKKEHEKLKEEYASLQDKYRELKMEKVLLELEYKNNRNLLEDFKRVINMREGELYAN